MRAILSIVAWLAFDSAVAAADASIPSAGMTPAFAGYYAAIGGGYGAAESRNFNVSFFNFVSGQASPHGPSGSGSIGFNGVWGSILAGLEFDLRGSGERTSKTLFNSVITDFNFWLTGTSVVRYNIANDAGAHLSGRVGVIFGNTLLFAKGGLGISYVQETFSAEVTGINCYNFTFDFGRRCLLFLPVRESGAIRRNVLLPSTLLGIGIEHNIGSWFVRGGVDAELVSGLSSFSASGPRLFVGSTAQSIGMVWTARGNAMIGLRF